ncbi:MAG: hypothetical protein JXA30_23235 [Deltaproteobacteria bacterium]|nr:hypothetical protein [Deltaproteobacteria bacterium]
MSNPPAEMLSRLVPELISKWEIALFFFLLALVSVPPQLHRRLGTRQRAAISRVVLFVAVASGIIWGIKLSWISDDAFISYRYAANLAEAKGLVFNPGERVEGYTNFLWTMLSAMFIALGIDPGQGSIVVGLCCFASLIALVWRLARALSPRGEAPAVSIAAIWVATNAVMVSFSTSGLETMAAAAFALLALQRALAGAATSCGLLGVAAIMTHPDHAIFFLTLGVAMAMSGRNRADLIRYAAPFLLIYLPYFFWRWCYYGDFFPNTFYAKSAQLSYFSQGGVYLLSFFIGSGFWAASPLILYTLFLRRHSLFGRYLLFSVPLYLFYLAKIGGDFMYGRLLVSLIAPLLIAAEVALRELWSRGRYCAVGLSLLLLSIAAVPVELIRPWEQKWGISDERSFYRLKSFSPIIIDSIGFRWARSFKRQLVDQGLRPTLGVHRVGMVGYFTRLKVVDLFGITNRDIARRPISRRGRPGHEKSATSPYIVASEVDISDTEVYPEPYDQWTRFVLGKTVFQLVHYEPATVKALQREKGGLMIDFDRLLDAYLSSLPRQRDREQLACDAWFFQEFYFSRVDQPEKRRALERRLLELSLPSEVDASRWAMPADFRRSHRPNAASAIHFDPEDERRFEINGAAFAETKIFRQPIWRGELARNHGSILSTYHPHKGDEPIAHLISEPFELIGDVMELGLAGGRNSRMERVALMIDEKIVFSATGCNADMIGQRLWYISPYRGKKARLQIIDGERGPWGHIIVDEVVQWVYDRGLSGGDK